MSKVFKVIGALLFLLCISTFIGCNSPDPKPEPIYPAVSKLPPIPVYTDRGKSWSTGTGCWVWTADDAKWNNMQSPYAKSKISSEIVPLIRQELSNEGYQVKMFDNEYLTRSKRLSIQKIVLCKGFEITKTLVLIQA